MKNNLTIILWRYSLYFSLGIGKFINILGLTMIMAAIEVAISGFIYNYSTHNYIVNISLLKDPIIIKVQNRFWIKNDNFQAQYLCSTHIPIYWYTNCMHTVLLVIALYHDHFSLLISHANEFLVYFTIMNINDFSQDVFRVFAIIFLFF